MGRLSVKSRNPQRRGWCSPHGRDGPSCQRARWFLHAPPPYDACCKYLMVLDGVDSENVALSQNHH